MSKAKIARQNMSTHRGGFRSVPKVKDLRIKAAIEENTKQCIIVLGLDLQAAKDAKPFIQEDLMKQVDEVKKHLKVYNMSTGSSSSARPSTPT